MDNKIVVPPWVWYQAQQGRLGLLVLPVESTVPNGRITHYTIGPVKTEITQVDENGKIIPDAPMPSIAYKEGEQLNLVHNKIEVDPVTVTIESMIDDTHRRVYLSPLSDIDDRLALMAGVELPEIGRQKHPKGTAKWRFLQLWQEQYSHTKNTMLAEPLCWFIHLVSRPSILMGLEV